MPQIVGKEIGPIAYGMMNLTFNSEPLPTSQQHAALTAALASNSNFWNAGTFYGPRTANSITLLQSYLRIHPTVLPRIVLSVKGCYDQSTRRGLGTPSAIKAEIDGVLDQLREVGVEKIDVFECARVDPDVPIEVTLKYIDEEYVKKGLVGGIALSEVAAATIRRAAKVTTIVSVENELSLWETGVLRNGVAEACAELGIPILAYSPIGKGMLSGTIKTLDDIPANDVRRYMPRFQPDTFSINIQLVDAVRRLAEKKGCTPAQLAINWTRCLSRRPGMPQIIPLPGSSNEERVRENNVLVDLTDEEMDEIDAVLEGFTVVGGRYPEGFPIDG
ncbi:NADP-dependent oxidoreductase domain-containing protein [Mycena belliarum]|uniref:NADP-dependent oxidoreductase domain-containing protein n=1 Tax=Mycena belliarum TaxID=1033014 RepID=A0AAD6TR83_9AGAR|nr:NADP-dependent oxidoreductase domain-containing protein [Mycena belliae]